ncbi:hypothetical protein BAE44_0003839 [Dichanthelium oligosanthes]|uniref:Uncharacterized protein n=1 Tax=Dichanthelium oligosanthes TaxID=888268 RepID=A0A1E5WCN6_9POAL|nr:hypothetical protein BAE44_0003839 [Dichanthelium oligosanthes]
MAGAVPRVGDHEPDGERANTIRQIDIYDDWPRGRSLNAIRDQLSLSSDTLWDVQWANGTSYLFDAASCQAFHFAVGLLPPDWKKARSAAYLGRDTVDGFN